MTRATESSRERETADARDNPRWHATGHMPSPPSINAPRAKGGHRLSAWQAARAAAIPAITK
jgi:hypothetical protein